MTVKEKMLKAINKKLMGQLGTCSCGLTSLMKTHSNYIITHKGKVVDDISAINKNLEIMFGIKNFVQRVRRNCTVLEEVNDPDFMYTIEFK